MPSGAGSAVALPCHMVHGMEGVGACLFGTSGGETWGIDAGDDDERGKVFSPMDCDSGRLARCPPLVHRYRIYRDPFPHPALRDGVIPRLLSCVCRAMAIARLTHLRILIPSSRAPPGQVPAECFPGETAPVTQPRRRRVSLADGVPVLDEEDSPECSQLVPPLILPVVVEEAVLVSEAGVPSLILPVVEELNNDAPAAELVEMEPSTSESGLLDIDDLCTQFSGDSSLTLSPISRGWVHCYPP